MKVKAMKSGIVASCVISLIAGMAGATTLSTPAAAQSRKLSDKSVKVLMNYAWQLVPAKFTTPSGKVIKTDKKNRKAAMVPLPIAREAIRVGRLSAYAQICDLSEAQAANFNTFMRLERAKKKWSEQQMLFVNQLHLFTLMWLSGKAKLVARDGDKPAKVEDSKAIKTPTCNAAQRKNVLETIAKYVNAHPAPKSSIKPVNNN